MSETSSISEVRKKAMDFLARREHGVRELEGKLRSRGYDDEMVAEVLEELQRDRLLSDERFVEAFVRQRQQAGSGPVKIRYELQQKGIAAELVDRHVDPRDQIWEDSMRHQRERKFGATLPDDYATRMKQARFLQNRGFSPAAVMRLFRC